MPAFLAAQKEASIDKLISEQLNQSVDRYKLMAESLINATDKLPRTIDKDGNLVVTDPSDWVSGFVPGTLWMLSTVKDKEILQAYARNYTARLDRQKHNKGTHDLGFMLLCSYGTGLNLTGDEDYKQNLITGAESLATRYTPLIGCIKSWDWAPTKWQYPVIIDNMMNLELLLWAAQASGNDNLRRISISHADKTMENHYRPDFSSWHVVSYDTITGKVEKKQTHQGYADNSAWARGQAWGLYGYTVMYRYTRDTKYLRHAQNIASFLINHPNLPPDKIPYWDFNAPDIPNAKRDASAAAIIASALIELSQYVNKSDAKLYRSIAEKQIRTLSSPEYFAQKGTNGNFLLKHSVGHLPGDADIDVPLTYADYYYIEAMKRYISRK
jgi:hypothetical protein